MLSEFNNQWGYKRIFVLIFRHSDKILIVWVLSQLFNKLLIGVAILFLNKQWIQCHSQRLCRHTCIIWKKLCIFFFDFIPWDYFCFFTHLLFAFIFILIGWSKSLKVIWAFLLNLYIGFSLCASFFDSTFFLALLLYHFCLFWSIFRAFRVVQGTIIRKILTERLIYSKI